MTDKITLTAELPAGYEPRDMWLTIQKREFGSINERWALYFRDAQGYSIRAQYGIMGKLKSAFGTREEARQWLLANTDYAAALQHGGRFRFPIEAYGAFKLFVKARPSETISRPLLALRQTVDRLSREGQEPITERRK